MAPIIIDQIEARKLLGFTPAPHQLLALNQHLFPDGKPAALRLFKSDNLVYQLTALDLSLHARPPTRREPSSLTAHMPGGYVDDGKLYEQQIAADQKAAEHMARSINAHTDAINKRLQRHHIAVARADMQPKNARVDPYYNANLETANKSVPDKRKSPTEMDDALDHLFKAMRIETELQQRELKENNLLRLPSEMPAPLMAPGSKLESTTAAQPKLENTATTKPKLAIQYGGPATINAQKALGKPLDASPPPPQPLPRLNPNTHRVSKPEALRRINVTPQVTRKARLSDDELPDGKTAKQQAPLLDEDFVWISPEQCLAE